MEQLSLPDLANFEMCDQLVVLSSAAAEVAALRLRSGLGLSHIGWLPPKEPDQP